MVQGRLFTEPHINTNTCVTSHLKTDIKHKFKYILNGIQYNMICNHEQISLFDLLAVLTAITVLIGGFAVLRCLHSVYKYTE